MSIYLRGGRHFVLDRKLCNSLAHHSPSIILSCLKQRDVFFFSYLVVFLLNFFFISYKKTPCTVFRLLFWSFCLALFFSVFPFLYIVFFCWKPLKYHTAPSGALAFCRFDLWPPLCVCVCFFPCLFPRFLPYSKCPSLSPLIALSSLSLLSCRLARWYKLLQSSSPLQPRRLLL